MGIYNHVILFVQIEVAPCNKKGREYTEKDDKFVDSPDELIGKDVHFLFKIINCRGLPNKYTDVYCKYKVYLDEKVGFISPNQFFLIYNSGVGNREDQLNGQPRLQSQEAV